MNYCSFCGKAPREVRVRLAGPVPSIMICSDCVMAACDQVTDHARNCKPVGREISFADRIEVTGLPPRLVDILGRAARAMTMAEEKFPTPNYTALKVAEEAGEVIKAAVHYAEGRGRWSEVEGEAVQAIAMIMRLLHEGDAVNGIIPPSALSQEGGK